jgi:hypothetical protein
MPKVEITLPALHPGQAAIKQERARFNVVAWGRRAGKTTLGHDLCCEPNVLRMPVAWFAPTYKDMLEVWRAMNNILHPIILRSNASEHRIENKAGGVLEFWSLENVNAGRGRKYARAIIDEGAFSARLLDIWHNAIRPTLVDYHGDGYFFSTPKGRNGFWQLWQLATNDPEWRSWQMPTNVNPWIPQSEIEAMRVSLPERVFQQEILAAFIEDAGGVFRRVMDAATADGEMMHGPDVQYTIGVDWGKSNDWTVAIVLDHTGAMVAMDRFNQIDYALQLGRLYALCDKYPPSTIIAESNSMGQPLVEQLQRAGLPVQPFQTTNASKAQAIDALALAFERGDIRILPDASLIAELQAYEAERLPSGLLRYGAPNGMHDDCVMALALAWQGIAQAKPLLLWG